LGVAPPWVSSRGGGFMGYGAPPGAAEAELLSKQVRRMGGTREE
jgi:hypothetical protein